MKKTVLIVVVMAAILPLSCTLLPFDLPIVSEQNKYDETGQVADPAGYYLTGFQLDGSTWYELNGTFENSDDSDKFRIEVPPGVGSYSMVTYRTEGSALAQFSGLFGINNFPVTLINYDATDTIGTQQILAGSGFGADLDSDVSYIVVNIYGKAAESVDNYDNWYTGGRAWRIHIR